MENERQGRARLDHHFDTLKIRIPVEKNWLFILFFTVLLTGWALVDYFIILIGNSHDGLVHFPLILTIWSIPGFLALRALLWNLTGKEIITFGKGLIRTEKTGLMRYRSKVYSLEEVSALRAPGKLFNDTVFTGKSRHNALAGVYKGSILFKYKGRTIQIASGIDAIEAAYILEKLKTNRIIPPEAFD